MRRSLASWISGSAALFAAAAASADTTAAPTAAQQAFERFYEQNAADFICFEDPAHLALRGVELTWREGDLWVTEALTEAGEEFSEIFVMALKDLRRTAEIYAARCAPGEMYRVRVDCRVDCKLRFSGQGGTGALGNLMTRALNQRYGGDFFYEFGSLEDAERAACLIEKVIDEAQPCPEDDAVCAAERDAARAVHETACGATPNA